MSAIWAGLLDQEPALAALERAVASERVGQAYLFCGPADVGKTTAAIGLAQRLNCSSDAPAPCGDCEACRAVARRMPPRVRVIEPDQQKGSGLGQPIHRIETIRELTREVQLRAAGTLWRVYVLRLAEALREEAANSLLKALEEPPPRVVWVLTSEQPNALLPTIRSRAQRIDFGLVPTERIEQWLIETHGSEPTAARTAARLGTGQPGKALALWGDERLRETRALTLELAQALGRQPAAAALAATQRLLGDEDAGGHERIEGVLETLEWWYRDALVLSATGRAESLVNQDAAAQVAAFAERWDRQELRAGLTALHDARVWLRRNANVSLALEVLWLRLARGGRPAGPGD